MPRVTDLIRTHLERQIRPDHQPRRADLATLRQTEWDTTFEQYMRNRLIVGAFRYETFEEKRCGNDYNTIRYIEKKLCYYRESGNTEALVDIANLCMIEFVSPNHPNTHFVALDDTTHVEKLK